MAHERDDRQASTTAAQAAGALNSTEAVRQVVDAVVHNQRAQVANALLEEGERQLNQLGRQYGAQSDARLGGRVAEVAHSTTFNADAAMKGRLDLTAQTTAQAGRVHDAADVEIFQAGKVVDRAQIKYHSHGKATAKGLSHPKYKGQQKVGPSDQLGDIQSTARKEAFRNLKKRSDQAAHYEDTAQVASSQLNHEGIASEPLPFKGAKKLARSARKGKARLERVPKQSPAKHVGRAAGNAALAGSVAAGGMTALVSGATNGLAAHRGEISGTEALKRTAVDTAAGALDGGAKAATGALVKVGAAAAAKTITHQATSSALRVVARSNAVFAVGAVAVDAVVGGVKCATGKISGEEYAMCLGESASGAAGGWGGAAGGAALGSLICPVFGTAVGAVVGGIGGAIASTTVFRKIFD